MSFQDRIILLIDDETGLEELRDIFESPLGLVKELVISCFETAPNQGLLKYERELDSIKKRAAGVTRAHALSSYKIAEYSSYLFAFQQFFHSSYRARQGEVLEAIIYHSLKSANANPSKEKKSRKEVIKRSFNISKKVAYDVDFTAMYRDRLLFGQIRSTDVTGGTTAKGSLVDLLRFVLREKQSSPSARYLVVVWEPLASNQKQSLINKIWDSLRSELGEEREIDFKRNIENGWDIPNTNISIKLVYGIDEFGNELNNLTENANAKSKLLALWESIQKWDDLWLTYAIASLELENLVCRGQTNFQILENKLRQFGIIISNDVIRDYKQSSIAIAQRIAPIWTEETLPVTSPSDILNYLRDLVLLKMINVKVSGYDSTRFASFNSFF